MALSLEWITVLLSIVIGFIGFLYMYVHFKYKYWEKKGVPFVKPTFLFGSLKDNFFGKRHISFTGQDIYNELEEKKFGGFFELLSPSLVIRDPELIKSFLIKDFQYFQDRNFEIDETVDPLQGKNLFMLKGDRWKALRTKLSPTFTSGKMKQMFHLVTKCAEELNKCLEEPAKNKEAFEVREMMARFTTDVIASCAFGIEGHALQNPNSEFREMGRKMLDNSGFFQSLKTFIIFSMPSVATFFKIPFTLHEVEKWSRSLVKSTLEYREKNKVKRNDFLDLLIQLRQKGFVEGEGQNGLGKKNVATNGVGSHFKEEFSIDDITAQVIAFFTAGFETSATTASYALYELALNPDIQHKLREEIDDVVRGKHGGKVTYDGIQEMTYLDKVVAETLRKHTPAGMVVSRVCSKDYTLPGTDVVVEAGTSVYVPVLGLHHDPKYYPEPDKFDPERFSEEAKAARPNYTYLPFGDGPRICIGNRFALMQVKIGLVLMLSKYELHPCEKTVVPLEYDPLAFILQAKDGIWLKVVPRNEK